MELVIACYPGSSVHAYSFCAKCDSPVKITVGLLSQMLQTLCAMWMFNCLSYVKLQYQILMWSLMLPCSFNERCLAQLSVRMAVCIWWEMMSGHIVDIDECTENSGTCSKNAVSCVNSPGSFTCSCVSGFKFEAGTCTGITRISQLSASWLHQKV